MRPSAHPDPDPEGDYLLQAPVFLPALPFVTTIFGGLDPGKMVFVQGVISVEAERFQVDFQVGCSVSPRADIGLHFNPRFRPRPHVICNSLVHGHWMEETKLPHLPLKRGDRFELLFLFEEDHVKVSVNGNHYAQHPFKVPLAQMDTLGVSGDIFVKTIAFLPKNPFATSRAGYAVAKPLLLHSPDLAPDQLENAGPFLLPLVLPRFLHGQENIVGLRHRGRPQFWGKAGPLLPLPPPTVL